MFDGMSKEEFKKMLEMQASQSGEAIPMNANALFELFTQHGDDAFILARRKKLIELLKTSHTGGVLLLWAGFESDGRPFRQESTFNHLTGIKEPGVVLALDISDGKTRLFIPQQEVDRAQWVCTDALEPTEESAHAVLVDSIEYLGDAQKGYAPSPLSSINCYKNIISFVAQLVADEKNIFTVTPDEHSGNVIPAFMNMIFEKEIFGFKSSIVDITKELSMIRHEKDPSEVEKICEAIKITSYALRSLLEGLSSQNVEDEKAVQAGLESYITLYGGTLAFPSIIASGKNATILHYVENCDAINKNDLLLIDCGARYKGYCSDITRTVPISGTFSDRQKELYQIVLDTQKYIADIARPGYWLNNKDQKEKSLQHLAVEYLQERGYAEYFVHGIGHHLGLEVHDTSVASIALQDGDVFTIEPGLYLQDEGIGIRIEDDYLMTKNGVDCLSKPIPKEIDDIEKWIRGTLDFDVFVQEVM